MKKVVILFAGQGAQSLGMHQAFYHYPQIKAQFNEARQILGYDLHQLCSEDELRLNNTLYTQNAILATSLAIYEVMKNELNFEIVCSLGFSLGEASALYSAGVTSYANITSLIAKRALYMHDCALHNPGQMAAIIGLNEDVLQNICQKNGKVNIANYNSPTQLVISGPQEALGEVINESRAQGARRIHPLNVSGAFHSPLMNEAKENMQKYLNTQEFAKPKFDVIMNASAKRLDFKDLKTLMAQQITSPVYFYQSINNILNNYHFDAFIEIGPGVVLSGLVRKINQDKPIYSINSPQDIELIKEKYNESK